MKSSDTADGSWTHHTDDDNYSLITDSIGSQLSKVEAIKSFTFTLKNEQDVTDYGNILGRNDERRKAFAIRDILLSKRVPFSTSAQQFYQNGEDDNELLRATVFEAPVPLDTTTSLPPVSPYSKKRETPKKTFSLRPQKEKKLKPVVSKVKITTFTDKEQSTEEKELNKKLQIVLEILEKAKTDVDATKLYVKAAKFFYDLKFYDRTVFCYEQGTKQSNPEIIIDTNYLPITLQFTRKIERMNDKMREIFLEKREQTRNQLIYEESERQRLRSRYAHCQLFCLHTMILQVQDLWKAYDHLQKAFELSKDEKEYNELLYYFHQRIQEFTEFNHGKAEFDSWKQIVEETAGPISESHLKILLELEVLEPMNPSFQEWLGIRYTEKCDFLSALSHYKKARDLRVEKPSMKDTLLLWQVPVHQESYEDKERKKQIVENKSKKLMNQYHNLTEEQVQEMKRLEESNKSMSNTSIPLLQTRQQQQQQQQQHQQGGETQKPKKDFAWFSGRHEDANTIIYLPPPQGWHVD